MSTRLRKMYKISPPSQKNYDDISISMTAGDNTDVYVTEGYVIPNSHFIDILL